jgi:hypothetical protein
MVPRTEPHAIDWAVRADSPQRGSADKNQGCNLRVKNKSSIAGTIVDRLSLRNVQYRTHGNW